MSLYARLVRRLSVQTWFTAVASRVADPLDRLVHRLTGGRRLATPSSIPTLLLTTVGRRSGERHTVPLTFVARDDADFVVGTNFGRPHQPAWALNLLAHPLAEAEYRMETWTVRSSRVRESHRSELWPLFEELVPGYRNYRRRLEREIHMFRLERV